MQTLNQKLKSLQKSKCVLAGFIAKTHGIKGEIIFRSEIDVYPEETEPIFVEINNQLVPFFISENGLRSRNDGSYILKLDDINTQPQAEELLNNNVYLHPDMVDAHENEPDIRNLTGFELYQDSIGVIGIIDDYIDIPMNPLLQINRNGEELLIPFNAMQILTFDPKLNRITVIIPDGLINSAEE